MTSVFSQLWQAVAFPVLTAFTGETVVYTPYNNSAAGTPVTFSAPFAEVNGDLFLRTGWNEKTPRRATLEAPALVNGSPQTYVQDGTFEVLGVLWKVDRFGPRDAAQTTIHLKATQADQKISRVHAH